MRGNAVVLLHGAGLRAWVWDRLVPLIQAESVALDLPSRSRQATPASCASSLVAALDDRRVDRLVLVMHSLAGVLAADLARRLDQRLTACIYVAGVIPAKGSTFAKAIGFPGRFLLPVLFRLHPEGLRPSEAMIRRELCGDLKDEDSAMVIARYEAEFPGLFLSRVEAPPSCRSTYVRLTKDMSVPPAVQARMIARLAEPRVAEIECGHLAMLSRPDELAPIINDAARSG